MGRIFLSPPDLSGNEMKMLEDAIASNWIAPLGPHVDAFEREIAQVTRMPFACATSSGTAALHLALRVLNIQPGDEVWTSTLTFAATANAITYVGAQPVFVDSDARSWNMDPQLLASALDDATQKGRPPAAVIVVDLYGQCADYDPIIASCQRHGVPVVEDAAEALGATYGDRPAGSFGTLSILSFNGNKIITTSGGGMLLGVERAQIERARHLASQARESVRHYEHNEVGFNYRLSNILAAIGRAQLSDLARRVEARRKNNALYRQALGTLPGWTMMPEAPYGRSTCWLTCATIDPEQFGATRDDVIEALAREDIEARPVWKPMHQQPVFKHCRLFSDHRPISDAIFEQGICLPSGSRLTHHEIERVVEVTQRLTQ